jgi:hypothetical protein
MAEGLGSLPPNTTDTESVAAKSGDAVSGLPKATLGNLTGLVIALAALRAGQMSEDVAAASSLRLASTTFDGRADRASCIGTPGSKEKLEEPA